MSHNKKLFLLDAFALIYRAYFAFGNNQRYNSKGLNTSAALGFTNTLLEVLEKEKPSHIAVVFDAPAATNREIEYSDYKANREEMPEDIKSAIPYIKRIVEAFNIPIIISEGYEADDLIGTLAKKAEKEGYITYMMTPDKDFGQLVSENIFIYKPARSGKPAEVMGVKEVCERFEVTSPLQVIDILGLMGDKVDNIPGIPGIGEVTAKKLIKQFHSVEGVIENADQLKGKQQENVINFAEQGLLSKKLATIILDCPIEFDPKALELEDPDKEKITEVFTELEFRTLAKRVLKEEITVTVKDDKGQLDIFGQSNAEETEEEKTPVEIKTIENSEHTYTLVDTAEKRAILIDELSKQTSFCFDTETTALDIFEAQILGLAISFKETEAYYVNMPEKEEEIKQVLKEFEGIFLDEKIEKIAHNFKYDFLILKKYGLDVKGNIFDTMLAHYLVQPDMKHKMDILSEYYLGYKPVPIENLIGKKGKKQGNMKDVSIDLVKDYAAEDADITFRLKAILKKELEENKLTELYNTIEAPLIKVLANMEFEGIRLDSETLHDFSKELLLEITELEKGIIELAGEEFNIDSPKQLGDILFDKLKIVEKAKKTKTGQYSTGEDVLSKIVNKHEIVPKILDYRSLKKLKSTYVDTLPELVNAKTGRLHTTFMQTVAATGRLSSNNPNLQNIPIRTEKGREIRKAFIPRNEDYTILSADYSQIELRIIAALSHDEGMIEAFNSGQDIHAATAAKVFDVPLNEVTREMRSNAKMVNFGIIYGISAFGLAERINISRTEAKEIIESYFSKYPKINQYMHDNIEFARKHGYVETIMKRRRYLNDINSANAVVRGYAERNAINAPIQGSAADIIKIAMINIHKEFEKQQFKSKMLLQVHDELLFDVHHAEKEEIQKIVTDKMEHAVKMDVPLTVESGFGNNWLEAH